MTAEAPEPPRRVVIVGGGSAGWMTAAWLATTLPPTTEITLIESPHVATIGVGEGTVPAVRDFVRKLGIDDDELLRDCNATFKLGIRFEDWDGPGHRWWHPFFAEHPEFSEEAIADAWSAIHTSGQPPAGRLGDYTLSWQLAAQRRAPRLERGAGGAESWHPTYAFHFDAARFGDLLKERVALPLGVRTLRDHVIDVETTNGQVRAVRTETSGRVEADFFVDCTGFRRVLIKALGEPTFISYRDELPCDRAVTIAVPYTDPGAQTLSHTVATALSAGWAWNISLTHRRGVGYVYSSEHLSDTAAEAELRDLITRQDPAVHDPKALRTRHLRFDAGHVTRPLVGNCVALGLSEGFLEPLEATAIGVTVKHLRLIGAMLSHGVWSDPLVVDEYNTTVADVYDEIKDFLVDHYALSRRRDTPFWRRVTGSSSTARNDTPSSEAVFTRQSWICLADGFDKLVSSGAVSAAAHAPALDLAAARVSQQRVVAGFVPQVEYLAHVQSGPVDSATAPGPYVRTTSPAAQSLKRKLDSLKLTSPEAALLKTALAR